MHSAEKTCASDTWVTLSLSRFTPTKLSFHVSCVVYSSQEHAVSEQIREYNRRIEALAEQSYPEVALLKQVKGVGTLIALTFLLTPEDQYVFARDKCHNAS